VAPLGAKGWSLAGLVDARAEAAVAGELARAGGSGRCRRSQPRSLSEHLADPGHGAQQRHVAVVGAESAQLALAVSDFTLELVDQTQTRPDRALPRLRQPSRRAAADGARRRDRKPGRAPHGPRLLAQAE
jgi:hypothetical protein